MTQQAAAGYTNVTQLSTAKTNMQRKITDQKKGTA